MLPLPMRAVLAALFMVSASSTFSTAAAQVGVGQIIVSGLEGNQITLVDPSTSSQTVFPLTNTTGSGTDWVQSVLWDPSNPNDFYLGGNGFLGRLTITGPGTSTYALLSNTVGIISQISFDANGQLVVIDSTSDQVLRVDPTNGAITPITSGTQPWGVDANAGVIDPINGDIYVGANKALYKVPGSGGAAQLVSSGWTTGQFATCSGVLIDPLTHEVFITVLTAELVARVNADGTLTNMAPPHSVPQPNALAFDENGDFVVAGGQFGLNTIHRVPRAGGTPVPLGTIAGQNALATAVAVVRDLCKGDGIVYGTGCPGTGGFVPQLTLGGCAEPNQAITLEAKNGLGGATCFIFFGLAQAAIPMGAGCTLNVAPIVGPIFSFPMPGVGPGNGQFGIPGVLPPGTSGVTFTMQIFTADPAGPIGFASSNGLRIVIG